MLHNLSTASATLANSRGDLFATVRNLQVFIAALDRSDGAVRAFSGQLTGVVRPAQRRTSRTSRSR